MFFDADDFAFEPLLISYIVEDEGVLFEFHNFFRFVGEFSVLSRRKLTFEDGILDVVEVCSAKFQHLCQSFGVCYVVDCYVVHN